MQEMNRWIVTLILKWMIEKNYRKQMEKIKKSKTTKKSWKCSFPFSFPIKKIFRFDFCRFLIFDFFSILLFTLQFFKISSFCFFNTDSKLLSFCGSEARQTYFLRLGMCCLASLWNFLLLTWNTLYINHGQSVLVYLPNLNNFGLLFVSSEIDNFCVGGKIKCNKNKN